MLNFLKKIYRKIVPSRIQQKIYSFKEAFFNISLQKNPRINKLGKLNPHKTFYVINAHQTNWGILSMYLNLLPFVDAALQNDWIPVIDLKNNYEPMLVDECNKGKVNGWDLYLEQPQKQYSLEDILHSKKVIYSKWEYCPYYLPDKLNIQNGDIPLTDKDFSFWRRMYNICPFNETVIQHAEKLKEKYFPKNEKVLGVSFRRSFEALHFYELESTPPGTHIIRSTLDCVIHLIEERLKDYKYKYFFFSVDDREAFEKVKKCFTSQVILIDRPLGHHFVNGNPVSIKDIRERTSEFNKRENDVYLRGIEYMAEVYLLSKCDSFLSVGSSADFFAYIINNKKYEHLEQIRGVGDTTKHISDYQENSNAEKTLQENHTGETPNKTFTDPPRTIQKYGGGYRYWQADFARKRKSA